MKKALILALALSAVPVFTGYAAKNEEPIRIEGENFDTNNAGGAVITGAENMSDETFLNITTSEKRDDLTLTYTITAPKTGTYKMTGVTTRLSETWTSDYYLKINDGDEYLASSGASETGVVKCSKTSNATYGYVFKSVNLKKGENTLTVRLNQNDPANSGNITTYLDYFEFTPTKSGAFKMTKIADKATQGVFEYGDSVILYVESEGSPTSNMLYSYELTDVNEEILQKGNFSFPKGEFEAEIRLGQLDEGWYRLELFEYGTRNSVGLVRRFAVIKSIYASEINNGHWASDAAATWHFPGGEKVIDKALNVLSRTGVEWVRSRNGWSAGTSTSAVRDLDYKNGLRANSMSDPNPSFLNDYNGDLFQVYKETKNWGELYKGRKDGFEFGNEPDAHNGTGDAYTAMVKAAAIGITDGDPEMIKLNGGVAGTPQALFIGLLFENDIMSYLDAYAYHAHSDWFGGMVTGLRDYKCWTNIEYSLAYDKDMPIWLNESGIRSRTDSDGIVDEASARAQAQHFVYSTAESIAMGNDKRFFFLWSPYIENNGSFGCWDKNIDPHPVVTTMALTAREVKDSNYKGPVANTNQEFVRGELVDNGEHDVAIMYNPYTGYSTAALDNAIKNGDTEVTFTGTVTAIDYIGKEVEVRTDENGNSVINVDRPMFVRYEGEAPLSDYWPAYDRDVKPVTAKTFDVNERIVLSSEWDNQNAKKVSYTGYNISEDGTKVTLRVYNFNDEKVEGTIYAKLDDGYSIDKNEADFSIDAMTSQEITFTVSSYADTPKRVQKRIMFYGNMSDGRELSPLVAAITKVDEGYVATDITLLEDIDDESKWNLNNHGGGSIKRTDMGNGEMLFEYDMNSGAAWAYPQFSIDDETRELMKNSAGFTYKIKLAEDVGNNNCIQNLYVYLIDGSSYYFEGGMGMFIKFQNFSTEQWMQVTVPWNELGLWSGSAAAVFDPGSISAVGIGLNFYSDFIPDFYVKDVGIYYSDGSSDEIANMVVLDGVEKNAHYSQDEDIVVKVNLQGSGYERVKVLFNDDFIYDEAFESDVVEINLGKLSRGYYRFEAIGCGGYNNINEATTYFYVD